MSVWKRLSRSAWLALAAHLVAGLAMATVLRRGLETNADLADRMDFLAGHAGLWAAAWLTWTLAGPSIYYFYSSFVKAHRLPRVALYLCGAALVCDWAAQAIEVFWLPGLAARAQTATFLIRHRQAVLLTGALANALYTAAAGLLIWATRKVYPRWIVRAGAGVVAFGAGLTLAACLESAAGMLWTNAGLVPCLILWLAGTALTAGRRAE